MRHEASRVDEEGWEGWPDYTPSRVQCCDCRLVHDLRQVEVGGRWCLQLRRNERATAAARRAVGFKQQVLDLWNRGWWRG